MAMASRGSFVYSQAMIDASRLSLFASMRRDRLLFALVGTLALLFHMLQPLAAAQMPQDGRLVICTTHGVVNPGETPAGPLDSCSVCLIGGTCLSMVACKAMLNSSFAFPLPDMLVIAPPPIVSQTGPAGRQGAPLPAIRAPPFQPEIMTGQMRP